MKRTSRNGLAFLSALALTTAPVALAATMASVGLTDAAYAKPGNGNGGGNGNAGGNSNRGGNSAAAKDKAQAQRGGGGRDGGGRPDAGQRGGGGGLLEALGLKKRTVVVRAAPQGETRRAPKPVVTASPVPKPKPRIVDAVADTDTGEVETARGKSWKTRLDGELTTHPSELGAWNSARRSPVAIANMAEKYRMTGDASGAGGMIGALVVAYEDYGNATASFQEALDGAIAAERIDEETANRLIDGSLSEESIAATLMEFETRTGELFVYDDATDTYSCGDAGEGDCSLVSAEELDALNTDAATLSMIASDAALSDAIDAYAGADSSLEDANALVQPNRSTDPAVQEAMLEDVLDLLDLEKQEEVSLYEIPEDDGGELLAEDGLEPVEN